MRLFLALVASLAACVSTATAGDWYASVYGGVNRNSVIQIPGVQDETGGVFGGAVGRKITAIPGLRVEADLSYRTNDVDVFGFVTAQHETTGALFNIAYDVNIGGDVKAYVLAGGGYAHTEATFENIALLKLEASDIAFQGGVGASVPLTSGVSLSVGYRYFRGPVIEVFGTELSDGENHSLVGALTFDL